MIEYKIYQNVYDDMISGKKNIEIRLLNEKSNNIKKGDIIKFNILHSEKYLLVEVTNKYIFDNVDQLWEKKDIVLTNTLNYSKEQFLKLFYQIYAKEEVETSKIVGIEFKLIKKEKEVS